MIESLDTGRATLPEQDRVARAAAARMNAPRHAGSGSMLLRLLPLPLLLALMARQ